MERTEYRVIVKDGSYYELTEDINKFLKEAWECLGGVSISHDDYGRLIYAQAIIKKTK